MRFALAEILQRRGRPAEAGTLAGEALSIHGAKGDVTGAARLREYLDRLGIAYGA